MSEQIQDERFKKVHYDPKFQNFSQKKTKTKVEDRFKGVFTDDRFKIVGKTDKYGRQLVAKKGQTNKEMNDYYIQSSEDEEKQNENQEIEEQSESEEKQEEKQKKVQKKDKKQQDKKNKKQQKKQNKKNKQEDNDEEESEEPEQKNNKNKKGGLKDPFEGGFQWDEESSTDEEISEVIEQDDEIWEQEVKKKVVLAEDTSSILALQNYDWMNVTSKDLMVLFSSFCSTIGYIKKITVYPSQYGKEKMAEEQEQGPTGLWKSQEELKTSAFNKKKGFKKPQRTVTNQIIINADDKDNDIDINALRKYEKQRLQYYYAVIECDSVKTAVHIYENCNEQEFEFSSLALDLRFVPEDIVFPFEPKEKCTKLPPISQVKAFNNRSAGHTNVKLTWDEPQNDKFKFLEGKDLDDEDLDKIDWDEYLGDMESESSEEDSEDEEKDEKQNEKEDKVNTNWRSNFDKKGRKNKQEEQIEISFASGFGDIKKNQQNRQKFLDAEEAESGWDKYLRQKKEKKNAKKLAKRQVKQNDEDYFIDPNQQKIDKKLKKQQLQQLDILVDEDQVQREQDFKVDVADDRFTKVYQNPEYSLDPTHKNFKKDVNQQILTEQQKRRRQQKKFNENQDSEDEQYKSNPKKTKLL